MFWADEAIQLAYPTLARLALQVYATQASSVASERAFSAVGDVLTKKRNSMDPSTVCFCVVLSMNESHIPDVTMDLYDRAHDTLHAWKRCFDDPTSSDEEPVALGDAAVDGFLLIDNPEVSVEQKGLVFAQMTSDMDTGCELTPEAGSDDADEVSDLPARLGVIGARVSTSLSESESSDATSG